MLDIIRLYDSKTKKAVARGILEALPEWFGIAEAREEYIAQSAAEPFWCAYDGDKPIGFLYIHQTGDATLELYAMGVLKEYHRLGAGKALFAAAYEYARANGYCFIQVKRYKWANTRTTTKQIFSTSRSGSGSSSCSQRFGMSGTPARSMLWR